MMASEKPAKNSTQRPGVHRKPRSRSPSVHANHDDVGELDAPRQQSARDQAYVTHLATVVASLEKQIAEHTLKARDFESKAQKLENDLNEKIAEANRNAKGFVVELAARVDRVESVVESRQRA